MRRNASRGLALTGALALPIALLATPAAGEPVLDDAPGLSVPGITSDNVELVGTVPDEAMVSTAISRDSEVLYANTLTGITTYDISEPERPSILGHLPMAFFQNENVNLGERDDGTKFILIGFDQFGVTPTFTPGEVGVRDEIAVVDVSDPANPFITARVETSTRTHTVSCIDPECSYAYTSGDTDPEGEPAFSIINLANHTQPFEEAVHPSSVGPLGHDWHIDDAGIAWHSGLEGTVAYDISDPLDPQVLNSTDEAGLEGGEFNRFIHHNVVRPHAEDFGTQPGRSGDAPGQGGPTHPIGPEEPNLRDGNVLLVTEEVLWDDPISCDEQGDFQTWQIDELAGTGEGAIEPGTGTIRPLDRYEPEFQGTGEQAPAGVFCSAHYFTYHQDGFVAQGFYQQGFRLLDVRDPADITQVGFYVTGEQEVWGAQWVPERDADGHVTGEMSELVYVKDATRGLDVLRVELPDTPPADTEALPEPEALLSPLLVSPALDQKKRGGGDHDHGGLGDGVDGADGEDHGH
ncbi:hypothetical protein [Haloechinothrix sp. LS1_15]|uniref:LVIVD repeat-containing protein n=1 Tax=Haloechinothrix sp. LS1_15 TaxID=2652248 RepID=UPI0029485530|nr:hypothetical protein [Haloechinothrix sp. LS1_15]MDV6012119.1 hypothetical protein [Haloechinothrix sp. LS1_15]